MRRVRLLGAFLLIVGILPSPATASPIDYTFAGVLGDCPDLIHVTCYNGWSGDAVAGAFTFDGATDTLLAWRFNKDPGPGFTWLGPFSGSPWESSADGTASSMHFRLFLPQPIYEQFEVYLTFSAPLTETEGAALSSGRIARSGAPGNLIFPFVSGAVVPVAAIPESSTLLLLGLGLAAAWLTADHQRANSSG